MKDENKMFVVIFWNEFVAFVWFVFFFYSLRELWLKLFFSFFFWRLIEQLRQLKSWRLRKNGKSLCSQHDKRPSIKAKVWREYWRAGPYPRHLADCHRLCCCDFKCSCMHTLFSLQDTSDNCQHFYREPGNQRPHGGHSVLANLPGKINCHSLYNCIYPLCVPV